MLLFRSLVIFLFVVNTSGTFEDSLSILIQRIQNETGILAVCVFGKDNDKVNDIVKNIFSTPVVILTSVSSSSDRLSNNTPLLFLNENTPLSEVERLVLGLSRSRFVVVVCGGGVDQLEKYFAWIAERKFTRIFGIVEGRSFAYFPFAEETLKLRPLSNSGPLPNAMKDLNGFNFHTNVQMDAPRAFSYINKHGQRIIAGYAAQTFLSFIRKHNASYTEVSLNTSASYDIPKMLNATLRGAIHVSMNPYVHMPGFQQSYSFKYLRWTLLIPHNEYVDPHEYFTRPFSPTVWLAIAALVGYIIVVDMSLNLCLRVSADLWGSFSRTFCTFLSLSAGRHLETGFRFHIQVLAVAFILTNLYSVHLTSFLTVFIKAKQAFTMQDIVDAGIRILVIDSEVSLIPFANLPQGFRSNIIGVEINELNQQRYSARNRSFAYGLPSDKAAYVMSQQVKLDQPNFHVSTESMSDSPFGFILAHDSPFVDILSAHVLRQEEMGLLFKWEYDAIYQGREAGILKILDSVDSASVALTLTHLRFAWSCLGVGLASASFVFLGEIFVKKLIKCLSVKKNENS